MYIKISINDSKMKSVLLPIRQENSSVLKVAHGAKLDIKEVVYADLIKYCEGSKVSLEQIDAKEFKQEAVK